MHSDVKGPWPFLCREKRLFLVLSIHPYSFHAFRSFSSHLHIVFVCGCTTFAWLYHQFASLFGPLLTVVIYSLCVFVILSTKEEFFCVTFYVLYHFSHSARISVLLLCVLFLVTSCRWSRICSCLYLLERCSWCSVLIREAVCVFIEIFLELQ